jgi:hypothetical protein
LLYELTCALAADTSVKQTITDRIIASAAANSQFKRPTQSVVSSGVQMPITSSSASVASMQSSLSAKSPTPPVGIVFSSRLGGYKTPTKLGTMAVTGTPSTAITVSKSTHASVPRSVVSNDPADSMGLV